MNEDSVFKKRIVCDGELGVFYYTESIFCGSVTIHL